MSATRIDEKAGRGQKIRTEMAPEREKAIAGSGKKASYNMLEKGGVTDLSHSISDGKVKTIG